MKQKDESKNFLSFFITLYKTEQKNLIFGDCDIDKNKLHMHKKTITMDRVDIKN